MKRNKQKYQKTNQSPEYGNIEKSCILMYLSIQSQGRIRERDYGLCQITILILQCRYSQ